MTLIRLEKKDGGKPLGQAKGFPMAHTITHFTPDMRQRLDGLVDRVGKAVNSYIDGQARRDEMQAPEDGSDEGAAGTGLRRDRIMRHVLRPGVWV